MPILLNGKPSLEIKDRAVFINGEMLEEDYVTLNEAANTRTNYCPIVVGHSHYFVLGNNRNNSSDSRHWGTIERQKIKGRSSIIYIFFQKKDSPLFGLKELVREFSE